MPALHDQPYPSFRVSRIAWLEGEIRREHETFLSRIPPLNDGGSGRIASVWQMMAERAVNLLSLCSELEGLQARDP